MPSEEQISLNEAARRAGVSPATLTRWADEKIVPVRKGRWTPAAAAQARIVARMRERGHSLDELKEAGKEGKLAFGMAEDLFVDVSERFDLETAAERSGLSAEVIQRVMTMLGTPADREQTVSARDIEAFSRMGDVARAGLPVEAVLQLTRVYAQSIRRIADAEVRLFHLFVHEPMIRDGVSEVEMAQELGELARVTSPSSVPLFEYLHERYVRYFLEQDVIGHMESDFGGDTNLDQVRTTLCFIDLTGFTRFNEQEGDATAFSVIEQFTETVEATLPPEAGIVKTIGDEVMVVSPDPASLAEWAVGFLALFTDRPKPRAGIHHGAVVFRDGDYFGSQVNLAHRVVNRALGGEVLITDAVAAAISDHPELETDPIGEVELKGFPVPTPLFLVRARS
ncbi:MAG: MerR family transcriptional regulator [Solirubrobacterales bacterium]|nr:MerR family transcriptional regulator [Solirubrobacterales bacterium]HMT05306.1 adenylate cyclase regulatory domain-containing protein [Solirubrobacterales bacterium]